MRYANIYIYIFVLHRSFFQQPRGRVAPKLGRAPRLGRSPQLGRQIKHFTDTIRYSAKKRLPLHLLTDKGNR